MMKFKEAINKFRTQSIYCKIYLIRVISYVSIAQSFMILYLFLSDLLEKGIINSMKVVWIILPFVFVALLIVGYFEVKWGFFRKEREKLFDETPQMVKLLRDVKYIKNKLGGGKE